jgi:hypothetical protein
MRFLLRSLPSLCRSLPVLGESEGGVNNLGDRAGGLLLVLALSAGFLATHGTGAALATDGQARTIVGDLASNEDFWSNLAAYGRYFTTVMLGTAYVM